MCAVSERELQRLIDIQVSEINRATKDALTNRQAQYADTIRREWDIVNERGEAFASLASRVDSARVAVRVEQLLSLDRQQLAQAAGCARDAVRMEQLLSRDRQQLAQAFAWKANGRIASVEDLRLRLQAADKLLTEDKRRADQALLFEQLHLAVAAASEALDASEGSPSLAARLAPLQALTAADECVGAALASIPEDVLRRGVPALQDLAASFEPAAASARVRLLVPEGGGLAWEAYARLASLANRPLKDEVPPEGSSGEVLLRRARCHLKAGEVGEAVQELSKLPIGAQRAVEGWVAEARRRLVVRQALLLVGAHADAVMASLL
ncbi:mitochondrial inner membrane protein-domain-containing protein [Baffinella frigidus]|nr:mitochondrial inner membrane protein-domain-containing protein [Cryptophyta sp. CCMP2293]